MSRPTVEDLAAMFWRGELSGYWIVVDPGEGGPRDASTELDDPEAENGEETL